MDKESSEMLGKENKKPVGRGKKVLKVIGLCCAGLIGIIILFVAVYVTYEKYNPVYTDLDGNIWQKYEGDKSTPAFTVFAEQGGTDKDGEVIGKINISIGCDPKDIGSGVLAGDFTKGVERPNHCIISNSANVPQSGEISLDYYLLLSDGSLISLDGTVVNKIQVNVNDDGINIIQSEGTAYYRIQKQAEGKKFTIDIGPETFTVVGTELFFKISKGGSATERKYEAGVYAGSARGTFRKIPNWTSEIKRKLSGSKSENDDGVVIKEKQIVTYESKIHFQSSHPPTITPIDMDSTVGTDTLPNNRFILKHYSPMFSIIFIRATSYDQIKLAVEQFIADILKSNQLAVDKADQVKALTDAAAAKAKSNASSKKKSTSTNSGCDAGSHAETSALCCPDGQSLATDGKCWPDSSFGSSSTNTGTSCPAVTIEYCYLNTRNSDPATCWINTGQSSTSVNPGGGTMYNSGEGDGKIPQSCIPSGTPWQ